MLRIGLWSANHTTGWKQIAIAASEGLITIRTNDLSDCPFPILIGSIVAFNVL